MLSINLNVIIIFLLVWVLLFVLSKLFYNPIQRTMDKRNLQIDENHKAKDKEWEKHEQTLRQIEANLKKAKEESQQTREKFKEEALKEKERMIEEITHECRNQVEQAKKEMDKNKATLKEKLKSESEDLAEKIERKLLH